MRDRFNYAYSSIKRPNGVWFLLIAVFISLFVTFAIFFPYRSSKSLPSNEQVQNTSETAPTPTPYLFTENNYYFSLSVPSHWISKKYQLNSSQIFVFGELQELPPENFIPGNFVWIELFPVTDTRYTEYTKVRSLMGKDIYKRTELGGSVAVDTGTYIATERSGNVYFAHLPYKKNRLDQYSYDPYYLEVVKSLVFIN